MKDLITSTFTTDIRPNFVAYADYFQVDETSFYDIDIEKYKDGSNLWTVSLTYPVEYSNIYAEKLIEFYELHQYCAV